MSKMCCTARGTTAPMPRTGPPTPTWAWPWGTTTGPSHSQLGLGHEWPPLVHQLLVLNGYLGDHEHPRDHEPHRAPPFSQSCVDQRRHRAPRWPGQGWVSWRRDVLPDARPQGKPVSCPKGVVETKEWNRSTSKLNRMKFWKKEMFRIFLRYKFD